MPSKARNYLLSPLAESDLENIWRYTFRTWSSRQAELYHMAIIDIFERLSSGELVGRDAGDIRKGYLKCAVGRHVVFYQENADNITVVRILHQTMDIPARLESQAD